MILGALSVGVEQALGPLDLARRALYRWGARALGSWVLDRERRVVLLVALVATTALLPALLLPVPILALAPIALGVPHLLADLRYLVVQPGLHRRPGAWAVAGLLVVTGLQASLVPGLVGATLAVLLLAEGAVARRVLLAAPIAALLVGDLVAPRWVEVGFAHGHNAVAILAWAWIGGGRRGRAALVFVALAGLLAAGAADGLLAWTTRVPMPGGPTLRALERAVAPFSDPTLALRGVALYAFGQAVHYGLWLRLIPEDARARPAPRSWATSWRVLVGELGAPLLLGSLALSVGLALWAVADLAAARDGYLRLALFHGPLELAALGVLAVERRR